MSDSTLLSGQLEPRPQASSGGAWLGHSFPPAVLTEVLCPIHTATRYAKRLVAPQSKPSINAVMILITVIIIIVAPVIPLARDCENHRAFSHPWFTSS